MRKPLILLIVLSALVFSCASEVKNPFFAEWTTPFGVPPFDRIKNEHYMPAYLEGIKLHDQEIAAIVGNQEAPTIENTIDAFEASGVFLSRVDNVFDAMNSANTNDTIQEIAKEIAPILSEHNDNIALNEKLFKRIKELYTKKDELDLTPEQRMVLSNHYRDFVKGGADLNDTDKQKLREINKELSVLSQQHQENLLAETNAFELVIENREDLAGLPDFVVAGAAELAAEKGYPGKWIFTVQKPSMIPFLQYSQRRDLREKIYKAYIYRGDNDNANDNKKIVSRIAALRVEKAKLLGYKSHADFVLEENMSKNQENVFAFLDQLWAPSLAKAKEEVAEMQKIIDAEGGGFKLASWDWWYYAEKVKKAKYDLDEEMLKPYFVLENVISGAFGVANRLWGLEFAEIEGAPVYNEDVRVFEVKNADGSHVGVLFTDYFPRANKRGGAWSGSFTQQSNIGGKMIRPVNSNVGNFQKPTADMPALLTWDDVLTLYHELGHALHDLLSQCTYPSVSGTNVATDFVELPSQIMENWAGEPEVLATYARHYQTGEVIPAELVERMNKASHFNQGFEMTEYLAASYLDMGWHTLTEPVELDVREFENAMFEKLGLIPEIVSRYRSTYFAHIFTNFYAAGYFSYMWAEVLDTDAFQAFKDTELFDQKLAKSFRENILEKGGSEDPMELYKRFRGAEPGIEPLLRNRGLI